MTGGARRDGGARHSIGVAADRTGLTVHQLRAWERRHGAVEPERSEGGHRLYTDGDLRRLRLLGELTGQGRRIGQLAGLGTDALASLLEGDRAADDGPPAGREVDARAVALSLVYGPAGSSPEEEVERLRSDLPASVAVLVGGRGAPGVATDASGGELTVVDDFGAFGERLRELGGGEAPGTADRGQR